MWKYVFTYMHYGSRVCVPVPLRTEKSPYWLTLLLLLRKKWFSSYAGNSIYWKIIDPNNRTGNSSRIRPGCYSSYNKSPKQKSPFWILKNRPLLTRHSKKRPPENRPKKFALFKFALWNSPSENRPLKNRPSKFAHPKFASWKSPCANSPSRKKFAHQWAKNRK